MKQLFEEQVVTIGNEQLLIELRDNLTYNGLSRSDIFLYTIDILFLRMK